MSMFKIYVDGNLFYHPRMSKLAITEAKVTEEAESIDSFVLSAPYNHPYIDSIKPMASQIVCKKDGLTVFEGRALDDGSDLYNTHTWTCESALAYLKDTLQPPFDYQGSIRGLLEYFIAEHNKYVEDKKKFIVGEITVTDDNDYIHYSSSEYTVTLDAIKNKLIATHGGYLRIRYADNTRVLDYLSDFKEYSIQTVEFGKNLLDIKITRDHTERITALVPLGAKVTKEDASEEETEGTEMTEEKSEDELENDERIGISDVNGGCPYIYDEEAVNEIGWIWGTEIWNDVTLQGNLLTKARKRLSELVKGIISMELTIVDESSSNADIADIHAREYVFCKSKPHGINGKYLCLSKTTDYLNPSGNTIRIGASGISLTGISAKENKNLQSLTDGVEKQGETIDKIPCIEENISSLKENIHECYSDISKSSSEIILMVSENYIEKSELEEIQRDFQTSITQNSTEIRMDFLKLTNEIKGTVANNQELLEEYIRFKGALIELGKIGNAFTAELSNEDLAFLENGHKIAYISNQQLVITNAEIRNKLSLGNETRGWFDFIPRETGNLSIIWRDPI